MKSIFGKLLILGAIVTIVSCNKDDLTKATQKGANTFSCKVNGNIFKPFHEAGLFNDPTVLSVRNDVQGGFGVSAENQESSESVFLESPYLTKTGVYKLYAEHPNRGIYNYRIITGNDPGVYTTDSTYTGELTITRCDTVNGIYSGTFYFTAYDPATDKTVSVTDGRFDIKE